MDNGDKQLSLTSPDMNGRRVWPMGIAFLLFAASVLFPRIWFNLAPPARDNPNLPPAIELSAKPQIPGYDLTNVPLTTNETAILSTTNVVNQLCRAKLQPIAGSGAPDSAVFLATWRPEAGQRLHVLHHTPDICWAGAGWQPEELGQPAQTQLSLPLVGAGSAEPLTTDPGQIVTMEKSTAGHPARSDTITVPFQCRVFKFPGSDKRQLVIWCTIIGGKLLPEGNLFGGVFKQTRSETADPMERMGAPARLLAANHLWQAIKNRLPARGTKQFVRCSVALEGAWQPALERARWLLNAWIVTTPHL